MRKKEGEVKERKGERISVVACVFEFLLSHQSS